MAPGRDGARSRAALASEVLIFHHSSCYVSPLVPASESSGLGREHAPTHRDPPPGGLIVMTTPTIRNSPPTPHSCRAAADLTLRKRTAAPRTPTFIPRLHVWRSRHCPLACGPITDSQDATGPVVETETIGDTTVVRTVSGSVWEGDATLVPETSVGELDGPEEYLFGSVTRHRRRRRPQRVRARWTGPARSRLRFRGHLPQDAGEGRRGAGRVQGAHRACHLQRPRAREGSGERACAAVRDSRRGRTRSGDTCPVTISWNTPLFHGRPGPNLCGHLRP